MQGPREDSGFVSGKHPGVALIKRIFDYCSTQHPKTKVMVSGIREKEGAPQHRLCRATAGGSDGSPKGAASGHLPIPASITAG